MCGENICKFNVRWVESEGSYNAMCGSGSIVQNCVLLGRSSMVMATEPLFGWSHFILIYTVFTIEIIMTPTIGKPGMLGELCLIIIPDDGLITWFTSP